MTQNKGLKIIITGASGFIGSKLAAALIKTGAIVYGVSRKYQKEDAGMIWKIGDLTDSKFVYELIQIVDPDYIFHLASHVVGSRNIEFVQSTFDDNLVSTLNILKAIQDGNCKRLIITGSLEEGDKEALEVTPSSPYAASKIAASNYARMFYSLYNTPVAIATLFMVYGPGQKDLNKLVPYVIRKIKDGETPEVSSGVREIDWIFVDDVVSGLINMMKAPGIDGKSVEIGSGELISIKSFVILLAKLMNPEILPKFGAVKDREKEQVIVANVSKTKKLIAWEAETNLESGLLQAIDYYKNLI